MFEHQTYETIKNRTLSNIKLDLDKREGSILNTLTSSNSLELTRCYFEMGDIKNIVFIKNNNFEKLDDRVWEFGVNRKMGNKAIGNVIVNGKEGTFIPNGTIFLCNDLRFVMLNDVVIGQEDNVCYLEADEVGYKYNLLKGSEFTLLEQNKNIESIINNNDFVNGVDIETDEELRSRFLKVVARPSTSGNKAHYEEWALEVVGVGKAYVYPLWDKSNGKNGAGTVKVMIVGNDGLPVSEDLINATHEHINDNMPIGCELTVITPDIFNIDVRANLSLAEGYEIEEVNNEFEGYLKDYLKESEKEVVYTKVFALLANTTGVLDLNQLTINNSTSNITILEDKIASVGNIAFTEVM